MNRSEDFAFMPKPVPGSCLMIGNGLADGNAGCQEQTPRDDFNDHSIGVGSAYGVLLTERFLDAKGHAAG